MKTEPLIVTVLLDEPSHQYFTQLRSQYFPKYCNYLEAHITLFHKLPSNKKIIPGILKEFSRRPPMELEIAAVKSMGTGVAYEVKSKELMQLHKTLQQRFSPWLITQDRKRLWPHITVQNKVTAYKASQTLALLQQEFIPSKVQGVGLSTWLYKDGPWEKVEEYFFSKVDGPAPVG